MSYDPSESYPARPHSARHSASSDPRAEPPSGEPLRGWSSLRSPIGHHRDLRVLRRAYRWQRRVATFAALGYFTLFLCLSAFAPSVMTEPVTGGLTTGMLVGLIQLPVTWLAVVLYELTARRYVDPLARRLRRSRGQLGRPEPGR
jgi:uncharacterized membrane protein (DUF485 family)